MPTLRTIARRLARALLVLLRAIVTLLARAGRWWGRDIARRPTLGGKVGSGCIGLLVILCACSVPLAIVQRTGEAVGLLPTRPPRTLVAERERAAPVVFAPRATRTAQVSLTSPVEPSATEAPHTAVAASPTEALPTLAPPTATVPPSPLPPTATPPPTMAPTAVEQQLALVVTRPPGAVRRGAMASVAVRGSPGALCSITVRYKSGPSRAQGLDDKRADANGNASWRWKVGTRTTPGSWPVIISCGGETVRTEVVVP